MHQKSLGILIQRRLNEFLLINQLYLLDGEQSLGGGIGSADKFFLGKLDVCIAEGEEKHL